MNSLTDSLKELHTIHLELEAAQTQLQRGPKQIAAREGIVSKREQELKDFVAQLKQIKMASDSKSLELKTLEKKIDDSRAKLNAASSNREFDIIKGQIKADEMAKSVLEDEILEGYDAVDEEAAQQSGYEKKVEDAKTELKEFATTFDAHRKTREETVLRLQAELMEIEKTLPREPAERYRRLVQRVGAKAMSAVVNKACGNCYVSLTPQQSIQLKSGKILFCGSCGTLLYIDENS